MDSNLLNKSDYSHEEDNQLQRAIQVRENDGESS